MTIHTDDSPFSPANIAGLTKRLYDVRREIAQLKSEETNLTTILKEHCTATGEVIEVEGLPPLRVVKRGGAWSWDVESWWKSEKLGDRDELIRALEHGGLTVNKKVMDSLQASGLVSLAYKKYGWPSQQEVLAFDTPRRGERSG